MWIQTRHGFFSIVEHREDVNTVLIRARDRDDLVNLCGVAADWKRKENGPRPAGFEADRIIRDDAADYLWRLIVPRGAWREVSDWLMLDIDYDNFKNAVKEKNPSRATLYMRIWTTLYEIQRPPFRMADYRYADSRSRRADWAMDEEELASWDEVYLGEDTVPDSDEIIDFPTAADMAAWEEKQSLAMRSGEMERQRSEGEGAAKAADGMGKKKGKGKGKRKKRRGNR